MRMRHGENKWEHGNWGRSETNRKSDRAEHAYYRLIKSLALPERPPV